MKKSKILIFLLLSFIILMPFLTVDAAEVHIYDDMGYFSDEEITLLGEELSAGENETGIDMIIITSGDLGSKTPTTYLEDYSEKLYDSGLVSSDAVFMLYGIDNMPSEENGTGKYVEIHGYGACEYYLSNDNIENILDKISPYLSSDRLLEASSMFIDLSKEYILEAEQIYNQPTITTIPSPTLENGHIYDDGAFLSENELKELENIILTYEKKADADIIIITTDSLYGKSPSQYLSDYYIKLFNNKLVSLNAAVMLYVKTSNYYCQIHGYGTTEQYVNDYRIEKILDEIMPVLDKNNISSACRLFAENVSKYMNRHPIHDKIYAKPWMQLIIAAVLGAIIVVIMAASSGGKMKAGNMTYLDASHSGITARKDQYIRTSVTKRRRPQQQTSSSGGGRSHSSGGRSGGGRSHSGGGRRL